MTISIARRFFVRLPAAEAAYCGCQLCFGGFDSEDQDIRPSATKSLFSPIRIMVSYQLLLVQLKNRSVVKVFEQPSLHLKTNLMSFCENGLTSCKSMFSRAYKPAMNQMNQIMNQVFIFQSDSYYLGSVTVATHINVYKRFCNFQEFFYLVRISVNPSLDRGASRSSIYERNAIQLRLNCRQRGDRVRIASGAELCKVPRVNFVS